MNTMLSWLIFAVVVDQVTALQCEADVDSLGNLNMDKSLYTCAAQTINDPFQPITHVKSYVDEGINLTVSVKFEFNNLVAIDELENTATVDFFYRLWWQDARWNFTDEFWQLVPDSVFYDGIELNHLMNDADEVLPVWVPDLHFIDVLEVESFANLVKLRRDGNMYWSRHMVATVLQPDLNLEEYPNDSQNIVIAFESYGLTKGVMSLSFTDDPVGYITDKSGAIVFAKNPIWYHQHGDYTTSVFTNNYTDQAAFERLFQALEVSLKIERAGSGILVRYALPILILLVLSAATFWADPETRIDTTMTILLSVSALYVVIIEGIPQVGYLTTFDDWIFVMYTTLAACVVLHQFVIVLMRKQIKTPMRGFLIRFIESFGRVIFGPMACIYYLVTFMEPSTLILVVYLAALAGFVVVVGLREFGGLRKSVVQASIAIQEKLEENPNSVTTFEMMMMNLITFRVVSVSTKYYKSRLNRRRQRESEVMRSIELQKRQSNCDSDDDEEED